MLVSREALSRFMNREFDSWLWMKELRAEEIRDSLRSLRVRPRFKTEPWLHQLVCFFLALHNPRFLFLLDMGLGKTKILLDVATQLIREKKIRRACIFVPRIINVESWRDDTARHSGLEFWSASVSDIEGKRDLLLEPQGDITVIDYPSLHLALSKKSKVARSKKNQLVKDDRLIRHFHKAGYGMLGLDESHRLGNRESLWFSIMRQLTEPAEYVYASTGTLFGSVKDMEGIWSQYYLVDQGETFGENISLFRNAFFRAKTTGFGTKYEYDRRYSRLLNQMICHRSVRYDEDEVLDLPKRMPPIRRQLELTDEQMEHYLNALQGLVDAGGRYEEMEAQWFRMRQITSGYRAWKDEYGEHLVRFKQNPKLEETERLLEEMGDSKIVITHEYVETGRLITDRLKELGYDFEWLYGGTKDPARARRRFIDDPRCRIFVMNAAAGGTGTDGLQSVARYMVLYETPASPKERQQLIKRIHRSGQTKRTFFYDLCMRRTVDMGILDAIEEGRDLFAHVVNSSKEKRQNLLKTLMNI
jgi:superfamily II DNA or RNA helicase